jgi:hypothetical protein
MKVNQSKHSGNVIPFQARSERSDDPVYDAPCDNIIRILDLSKFERPRTAVDDAGSMRANIAAMILLGLLVFFAKEEFCKLERSTLCSVKSECIY